MFEHKPRPEWVAVEEFLSDVVVHPDPALQRAVQSAVDAGMPPIEVTPNAGKLLKLLVGASGARRVLEIGTLAGFSTIWMAQGLPDDGRLVTCEYLAKHAEVARANVDAAGLGHKVEIRIGAALDTLAALEPEGVEAVRLRLHRRGQGKQPAVPGLGGPAGPARHHHRDGQRGVGGGGAGSRPWTRSMPRGSSTR